MLLSRRLVIDFTPSITAAAAISLLSRHIFAAAFRLLHEG
jgi:hypothetical protein